MWSVRLRCAVASSGPLCLRVARHLRGCDHRVAMIHAAHLPFKRATSRPGFDDTAPPFVSHRPFGQPLRVHSDNHRPPPFGGCATCPAVYRPAVSFLSPISNTPLVAAIPSLHWRKCGAMHGKWKSKPLKPQRRKERKETQRNTENENVNGAA